MGLILLSLLQFVVRAFHDYNSVVLEEINNGGSNLSQFCSVTDRNTMFSWESVFLKQQLCCPVFQSRFPKCLQNQ